jgi:hypothetical protein
MCRSAIIIQIIFILGSVISINASDNRSEFLTQTIRGAVIDRDSKHKIAEANVVVLNTDPVLGASTNSDGYFVIKKVPIGRHNIEVTYIDYEPFLLTNILIGTGKEVVLEIELTESVVEMDAITITADTAHDIEKEKPVNEMASISARTFTVEETGRYAASINDPARMVLSYAGVTNSSSDAMNQIVIRGNSPRGMLWNIEGVPVSNPNHFAEEGSTGGAVCLISNNMLDNSDFLTGAWPASFGNALSGIFDIGFRKGNESTYENAFEVSPLGVAFSSEGPLAFISGASYLVNYRYSTLSLFDAAGISIIDKNKGLPDFQDLSYKLFIPTERAGVFSIWGIGGLSSSVFESEIMTGLTYDGQEYKYLEEEGEKVSSDIGIAGITHMYFINKNNYLKTAFSFNGTRMKSEEEGLVNNELMKINIIEFKNDQSVLSSLYNSKINSRSTFQTGFVFNNYSYDSESFEYDEDIGGLAKNVDASDGSILYQGYAQIKYKLNSDLTIIPGLHSCYFMLNENSTIEPRASLKWDITDKRSLSAGIGFHSQLNPLSMYLITDSTGTQINKDLDFLKARHYNVSYDDMFLGQWRVKLELYYQDLYNIPIAKDTTDGNFDPGYLRTYSALNEDAALDYIDLVNEGTGRNYGIELTIEKFFGNGWYFLSTCSVYEAKYKGLDGIERDTRFNGNYTLNLLAGKEYNVGNDNILGLNTRIIMAGGKRDNPVLQPRALLDNDQQPVIDPVTGEEVMYAPDDYDNAFSKQLDDYFRIDIGISYRMNYPALAHIFSLDIQNVLNRENIRKIDFYDVENNEYIYKSQAGIIPSIKYRIEF